MKIATINIGTTQIVFDNNMWTGHESIYVNGELVSQQHSFLGTDHFFELHEDGEWVEYVLTTGFGWHGITIHLTRNGVLLLEEGKGTWDLDVPPASHRNYRPEDLV